MRVEDLMIQLLKNNCKLCRLLLNCYRAKNGVMLTSSPMMSIWMYQFLLEGVRIR